MPGHASRLAMTLTVALAAARAPAAPADAGVCVAFSPGELTAVAGAVQRAIGTPSQRIDVRDRRDRELLSSRCDRLIVAVGTEALGVANERAPRTPTLHVMAANARARGAGGVLPDAEPRRVLETLREAGPEGAPDSASSSTPRSRARSSRRLRPPLARWGSSS